MMGGFDMRSFGQNPEWSIVTELKKQYDVTSVAADMPLATDFDVLLVAQPSSLTQKQIDNLTEYVKKGGPTLLFLDPFPVDNPQIAPRSPRCRPAARSAAVLHLSPRATFVPCSTSSGLTGHRPRSSRNQYNPHPQLADLPPEVVFIGHNSGAERPFNPEQIASSGLQEIVTLFPGMLRPKSGGSGPEFIPLLRTGNKGGTLMWTEVAQQGFMGITGINPRRPHFPTGISYTLAARLTGPAPMEKSADKTDPAKKDAAKKDEAKKDEKPATIKVIAIADLDLISEQFFELRRRKVENLDFDNVTFVLNCVDVLAGDESFVALRKKRPVHRTLETLEANTRPTEPVKNRKKPPP